MFDWLRNIRHSFKRFPKESEVIAAILETYPGYSTLQKTKEMGAESLLIPGTKDETVYIGKIPHVVEVKGDILPLPKIFKWMWLRRKFRIRIHHRLFDEPFTRDFYSGEILDQRKKKAVLIERGFQDQQGFLLDKEGNRADLSENIDEKVFVKVDVSDIDFIKAETKAVLDSKLVEKAADGMSKTGASLERNFWIILGISLLSNVALVFLLNGGLEGLGV